MEGNDDGGGGCRCGGCDCCSGDGRDGDDEEGEACAGGPAVGMTGGGIAVAVVADGGGGGVIDDEGCEGVDDGLDCCVLFVSVATAPEAPPNGRTPMGNESAGRRFSWTSSSSACCSGDGATAASVVLASMVPLFLFRWKMAPPRTPPKGSISSLSGPPLPAPPLDARRQGGSRRGGRACSVPGRELGGAGCHEEE